MIRMKKTLYNQRDNIIRLNVTKMSQAQTTLGFPAIPVKVTVGSFVQLEK